MKRQVLPPWIFTIFVEGVLWWLLNVEEEKTAKNFCREREISSLWEEGKIIKMFPFAFMPRNFLSKSSQIFGGVAATGVKGLITTRASRKEFMSWRRVFGRIFPFLSVGKSIFLAELYTGLSGCGGHLLHWWPEFYFRSSHRHNRVAFGYGPMRPIQRKKEVNRNKCRIFAHST